MFFHSLNILKLLQKKVGSAAIVLFSVTLHFPAHATIPSSTVPDDIKQSGFIYCINGVLNTFNPQIASGGLTVDTLAVQLYDRLLAVDPYTYLLTPELAERWDVLDGGLTYVFHLRRNVSFQTTAWFTPTRHLNADDVLFSFQRILDRQHPYHAVGGGHYPYFDSLRFSDNIKSLTKRDPYTIEFHLIAPDASFLARLATHYSSILSAEYANLLLTKQKTSLIDQLPVGTGPYRLNEYRADQFIRLARNELYWKGEPKMAQVVVDLGTSGTGRLSKLLTGECDVLAYPAASQLSMMKKDPRLNLSQHASMNIAYLTFNTQKAPLNNRIVRQAIALAINNPRLIESIYYGSAETASSFLPRLSWAFDTKTDITEYNPQKARELLNSQGINHLNLQLSVPVTAQSYNPSPLKMAALIQADMAKVGINVTIVPVTGRLQEARLVDPEQDLILTGWATDSNDPDSFMRPLLSCAAIQSQTNYAHWCHADFDALLQSAVHTQQVSERIQHYIAAQKILADELPILPLASSLHLQASRHDIKGLLLNPFGNTSFAGVYRDIKAHSENSDKMH